MPPTTESVGYDKPAACRLFRVSMVQVKQAMSH